MSDWDYGAVRAEIEAEESRERIVALERELATLRERVGAALELLEACGGLAEREVAPLLRAALTHTHPAPATTPAAKA